MGREDMVKVDDTFEFEDYALVEGSVEHPSLVFKAKVLYQPTPEGISTPEFPDGGNVVQLAITESGRPIYRFANGEEWFTNDFELTLMTEIVMELQIQYCEEFEEAVMAR